MYSVAYTMHRGKVGRRQQDCILVNQTVYQESVLPTATQSLDESEVLLAVADGLANSGGNRHLAPQQASRVALEELVKARREHPEWLQNGLVANRHLRQVQARLADRLADSPITYGAATTLAMAHLRNDQCAILNVGDSRLYLAQETGEWQCLSKDHTILQGLIDQGKASLDQEYAGFYGMLEHALTADAGENDFAIHRVQVSLSPGATLVLCSDGIYEKLGEERLWQLFNPKQDITTQTKIWRDAVWQQGASDNYSLIVLRRESP